jgi:hypothetical protein
MYFAGGLSQPADLAQEGLCADDPVFEKVAGSAVYAGTRSGDQADVLGVRLGEVERPAPSVATGSPGGPVHRDAVGVVGGEAAGGRFCAALAMP